MKTPSGASGSRSKFSNGSRQMPLSIAVALAACVLISGVLFGASPEEEGGVVNSVVQAAEEQYGEIPSATKAPDAA